MTRPEILNFVSNLLFFMTETTNLTEEQALIDDLGISSMDILTLISYVEEEFHIRIPERRIRKIITIGDLVDLIQKSIA
ncbi:MAG: acyl carrier protein [Clostridia bacterium]|nr:acyl carrier protein [Clostridia bacterium]